MHIYIVMWLIFGAETYIIVTHALVKRCLIMGPLRAGLALVAVGIEEWLARRTHTDVGVAGTSGEAFLEDTIVLVVGGAGHALFDIGLEMGIGRTDPASSNLGVEHRAISWAGLAFIGRLVVLVADRAWRALLGVPIEVLVASASLTSTGGGIEE